MHGVQVDDAAPIMVDPIARHRDSPLLADAFLSFQERRRTGRSFGSTMRFSLDEMFVFGLRDGLLTKS